MHPQDRRKAGEQCCAKRDHPIFEYFAKEQVKKRAKKNRKDQVNRHKSAMIVVEKDVCCASHRNEYGEAGRVWAMVRNIEVVKCAREVDVVPFPERSRNGIESRQE